MFLVSFMSEVILNIFQNSYPKDPVLRMAFKVNNNVIAFVYQVIVFIVILFNEINWFSTKHRGLKLYMDFS